MWVLLSELRHPADGRLELVEQLVAEERGPGSYPEGVEPADRPTETGAEARGRSSIGYVEGQAGGLLPQHMPLAAVEHPARTERKVVEAL